MGDRRDRFREGLACGVCEREALRWSLDLDDDGDDCKSIMELGELEKLWSDGSESVVEFRLRGTRGRAYYAGCISSSEAGVFSSTRAKLLSLVSSCESS